MGSSALDKISMRLEKLAKPVLGFVSELIEAVSQSKTEREAARRVATLAARKILLG